MIRTFLGALARATLCWLCLVGLSYLLHHPAPVEPATVLTAAGALVAGIVRLFREEPIP